MEKLYADTKAVYIYLEVLAFTAAINFLLFSRKFSGRYDVRMDENPSHKQSDTASRGLPPKKKTICFGRERITKKIFVGQRSDLNLK
jgi:hypothetical protein